MNIKPGIVIRFKHKGKVWRPSYKVGKGEFKELGNFTTELSALQGVIMAVDKSNKGESW
jgi:hypothetical protein